LKQALREAERGRPLRTRYFVQEWDLVARNLGKIGDGR